MMITCRRTLEIGKTYDQHNSGFGSFEHFEDSHYDYKFLVIRVCTQEEYIREFAKQRPDIIDLMVLHDNFYEISMD